MSIGEVPDRLPLGADTFHAFFESALRSRGLLCSQLAPSRFRSQAFGGQLHLAGKAFERRARFVGRNVVGVVAVPHDLAAQASHPLPDAATDV